MKRVFIFCFIVFNCTLAYGQDLTKVINDIVYINVLHTNDVGFRVVDPVTGAGDEYTQQYKNYLKLSAIATTDQLVSLTGNYNKVLATYALWALLDRNYNNIEPIVDQFLQDEAVIRIADGCMPSNGEVLSFTYVNRSYYKPFTQLQQQIMDSLTLYTHHYNYEMLRSVLRNRSLPARYLPQIEFLAFTWNRIDAIFYLHNLCWPKPKERLREATLRYFERIDLSNKSGEEILRLVTMLLEYNDTIINEKVVTRLKENDLLARGYKNLIYVTVASYGLIEFE